MTDEVRIGNAEEATRALRQVLETFGLYRKRRLIFSADFADVERPPWPDSISLACDTCADQDVTTWHLRAYATEDSLPYRCGLCGAEGAVFYVQLDVEKENPKAAKSLADLGNRPRLLSMVVWKVGQWPPASVRPSKAVSRCLDPEMQDLYRKGLTSLHHAFGIGAFAYFRRVVESRIDALLDLVYKAADVNGDGETKGRIEQARMQNTAAERLHLAADALPVYLRPGGVNPLAVLYGQFSQGLHALEDARCLEIAAHLREAFEYVLEALDNHLKRASAFKEKMTSWASRPPQT
jgi:hypothetical protein